MTKVDGYEVPEGLYYTKEWAWAKIEGDKVRCGITDYAQRQLREIVFVELPSEGGQIKANEPYGTVESVKSVSDLVAPITGKIEKVNPDVSANPALLNEDPFGKAWLLIVTPANKDDVKKLMDHAKAVEWHKSLVK
jgi:glycine cleavage system H protein